MNNGKYGLPKKSQSERGSATVATDETTSSTSYVDLATVGPVVSLITGTEVLVTMGALTFRAGGAGFNGYIAVAVSGASSIAANDAGAALMSSPGAGVAGLLSRTLKMTGLTPGLNTFTLKYRANGGGAWNFINRDLTVQVL
jgi:hypothetical protein